ILVHGKLSALIESGEIRDAEIVIPKAALDELQAQASRGKDIGFSGLEEIKKMRATAAKSNVKITFTGERPTMEDIQLAKKGRIDAIIRDAAAKNDATLMTADYVQALVAEAEGVPVHYVRQELSKRFLLEEFFTPDTQSVHLKVGVPVLAKRGKPGSVLLHTVRPEPVTEEELKEIINQVVSKARVEEDCFIEMGHRGPGAFVVQLGRYRISIAQPPFSDGLELTAVRPIATVSLESYQLADELKARLSRKSQGILIAGPPGAGKSSFASALAGFLAAQGKIVKTFEQPRDLQVGPEITQYGPLEGDWEKTADLLLLVRPDYTIFDEVRKTKDFRVFADMRLAGVGMIGVTHATDAVSAIQRFVGRIELGVIPHVTDTVIYIEDGRIDKVFELSLLVKVPSGMVEADLARPVVEVRDLATHKLEYEIYTYGEENVLIPVADATSTESGLTALAKHVVLEEMRRYDPEAAVSVIGPDRVSVQVRNHVIGKLIGKEGANITALERKLGIRISVEPREGTLKRPVQFSARERGGSLELQLPERYAGQQVDLNAGSEYLLSANVGKDGV
ncbi:MAG TPA: PINc/VapC family ATPase, partial [archaeon]|nr:PINc/VapC family ATPase [archaeon]